MGKEQLMSEKQALVREVERLRDIHRRIGDRLYSAAYYGKDTYDIRDIRKELSTVKNLQVQFLVETHNVLSPPATKHPQ